MTFDLQTMSWPAGQTYLSMLLLPFFHLPLCIFVLFTLSLHLIHDIMYEQSQKLHKFNSKMKHSCPFFPSLPTSFFLALSHCLHTHTHTNER